MIDVWKDMNERGDYVAFFPDWVTLDGRFTAVELRAIADEMERTQESEEGDNT